MNVRTRSRRTTLIVILAGLTGCASAPVRVDRDVDLPDNVKSAPVRVDRDVDLPDYVRYAAEHAIMAQRPMRLRMDITDISSQEAPTCRLEKRPLESRIVCASNYLLQLDLLLRGLQDAGTIDESFSSDIRFLEFLDESTLQKRRAELRVHDPDAMAKQWQFIMSFIVDHEIGHLRGKNLPRRARPMPASHQQDEFAEDLEAHKEWTNIVPQSRTGTEYADAIMCRNVEQFALFGVHRPFMKSPTALDRPFDEHDPELSASLREALDITREAWQDELAADSFARSRAITVLEKDVHRVLEYSMYHTALSALMLAEWHTDNARILDYPCRAYRRTEGGLALCLNRENRKFQQIGYVFDDVHAPMALRLYPFLKILSDLLALRAEQFNNDFEKSQKDERTKDQYFIAGFRTMILERVLEGIIISYFRMALMGCLQVADSRYKKFALSNARGGTLTPLFSFEALTRQNIDDDQLGLTAGYSLESGSVEEAARFIGETLRGFEEPSIALPEPDIRHPITPEKPTDPAMNPPRP